ncbi:hypothetical protein HDE80_002762 [Rhodanobacter sp. A1T4]|nr:hypothetical protein [Rhodanobacter sp. A1T4]
MTLCSTRQLDYNHYTGQFEHFGMCMPISAVDGEISA